MSLSRPTANTKRSAGALFTATLIAASWLATDASGALADNTPRPAPFSVVGAAPLGDVEASVLAQLNDIADRPFFVDTTSRGTARSIYGGRLSWDADDPSQAAARFVASYGALFGLDDTFAPTSRVFEGRRVHLSFNRGGIPVEGSALRLVLKGNTLVGAAGEVPPAAILRGDFSIDQDAAIGHARIHLGKFREEVGRGETRSFAATPTPVFLSSVDGLTAAWRVLLSGTPGGEAYVAYVDAGSGALLRVTDLVAHGNKGLYPFNGQGVPFKLGTASGNVFKTVDHAILGIHKKASLKNWANKGIAAPVSLNKGLLISAHADMWDANTNDPFEPSGKFLFDPFGNDVTADSFDMTNTLYQVEQFYAFVKKNLGPVASDFSLPIICNVDTNIPNAFFSPTTFPIDGHSVGYLQFHDLKLFLDETADFSRDASVVDHEYIHAMLFFEGLSFSDTLDYPTRAVGEAIPDFFATTHQGEPVIGRYLDAAFGGGFSRNLQDDDHFPETTLDAMTLTMSGLPEEHRNGEIFGSALVDLLASLNAKSALRRTIDGVPFMPANMASIGFNPVTPGNSVEATSNYFGLCMLGLLQSDAKSQHIGEVIGAATTRGIYGAAQSEILIAVNLEAFKKRKETYAAEFLAGQTSHYYIFRAKQGRKLSVKITGEKGSSVLPDFTIVDDLGSAASVTHTKNKVSSKGGRVISEGGILLNLPLTPSPISTDPFYVITVTSPAFSSGRYTLTLDA